MDLGTCLFPIRNIEQWNLKVVVITNEFRYPSNSKVYEKEPRYINETSLKRANFANPLARRCIEVPLIINFVLEVFKTFKWALLGVFIFFVILSFLDPSRPVFEYLARLWCVKL